MKCDLHCRSPHGRCTSVRGQRRAAQRPKLQTVWPGSSIGRLGHSHPVTDTNMSKANLTALTPESIGKWATQKTTRQNMGWKTWTEAKQMAKDRDLGWKTWTEAKQMAKDRDLGWKTWTEAKQMAKDRDLGWKTWTEAKQMTKDRDLGWKTWTEAKQMAKDRDLGWKTWTEAKQMAWSRANWKGSTAALWSQRG